jgi:hypothetical protein
MLDENFREHMTLKLQARNHWNTVLALHTHRLEKPPSMDSQQLELTQGFRNDMIAYVERVRQCLKGQSWARILRRC